MSSVLPFHAKHLGLPAGDAGVKLTIDAMIRIVERDAEGAMNPEVRAWALDATSSSRDRDDREQAGAIFAAVKRAIRFRGEYSETVQTPLVTLQVRAGDCDDHATLIVALLRSIGIPGRFKTVATDPDDSTNQFSHVYALAGLRRGNQITEWLPLDTTVPWSTPGWEAPRVTRAKVWGGLSGMYLGDDDSTASDPPQLSQKATNAVALINNTGQAITQVVSAFRNTGNATTVSMMRTPNGIQGNIGTSSTTLWLGAATVAIAALALLRKR